MTTITRIVAALGGLVLAGGAHAEEGKLYLFNWTEYMDPEIIEAFEEKYNVEVVQNYFNSLPEMLAKLSAGGVSQYDIIVPSNYYVPRLIETGLVQPLDHAKLPNLGNLKDQFRDPSFDPGNEYSAAYQWGTTGVIYNSETFPDGPKSWSLMFDPDVNSSYPFALMGDGQVSIGAACAHLGHGYDCTGVDAWKEAAKLLIDTKNRGNFSGFVDGTPSLQQLARGVTHVALSYNGDYMNFKNEDPESFANIEFMIPDEGTEMWVDSMMIPAEAPNPDLAHKFIDFILDAEIGAQLSNYNYYSSPNAAAEPYLDEVLTKPPVQPTEEDMARLRFTPSLKGQELQTFSQLWNEVQAR
ncbi:spermidine/putrescine ABC transporter substrate-binding protein [Halomonas sp. McH1-25]|uniref:ABC transporter substrate-binding protein n=1 Tax=unclassified Halomonas TaxID=2609666 RepID=UPI001EF55CB1|nr:MULTISPECIES: spermidine/putrescine ABC transporter substrate-binding protein [unclassified Halomonas]MCG7599021.1 spermidine/putrescine ABC transporter substrate-binding protein [Halomonas sp. McH1-25]MCP1343736.1 spermidine/putrescine ABC transporter substrate-binding protein [Halomonas sp. FL8]MCP1360332.1 spermidine/putrescine ABC transporter substrate-binding protein [Halomonas sp. BBD45]MCP1363884.1 spermidine/putrescine ABC transporter substrate-binding protein [Halomonas sp. BBD48]